MNLHIRGAGLLGLILLLAMSTASCEGPGREAPAVVKGAIEALEQGKVPESALAKMAADTRISSDVPDLVKTLPETNVEQQISAETAKLDVETANKDIAAACKLADNLPGKESVDPALQADSTVNSIEQSLRSARGSPAALVICDTADVMDTLNG